MYAISDYHLMWCWGTHAICHKAYVEPTNNLITKEKPFTLKHSLILHFNHGVNDIRNKPNCVTVKEVVPGGHSLNQGGEA